MFYFGLRKIVYYICVLIKTKKQITMTTIKENIWGLRVGDIITFTNEVNYKVVIVVKRVENKSWYGNSVKLRNSWNTLNRYSQYPDFKIIKN